MYPNVHCSTIYNSQDMEVTWMSINRCMDKVVAHIYNGILLTIKRNKFELAELRQITYVHMCVHTHTRNLEKWY